MEFPDYKISPNPSFPKRGTLKNNTDYLRDTKLGLYMVVYRGEL